MFKFIKNIYNYKEFIRIMFCLLSSTIKFNFNNHNYTYEHKFSN